MNDEDNSYKQYEIREGVIFLIEMSPDILVPIPELGNKCQLYQILTSINDLMSDMIITMKSAGVGIYFYNLAPHEVLFKHALLYKNQMYKLFSLNQINLGNMKVLNDIIMDDILKVRSITDVFKYQKPEAGSLNRVLGKTLSELERKGNFNIKKCMWFTNNDQPFEEEESISVRKVMDDFYKYEYVMQPVFLSKSDKSTFDMSKFQDMFLNTNYLKEEGTFQFGYAKDSALFKSALLNEQIRSNILRVKEIKRILFSCHLILSDGEGVGGNLGCSIKGYTIYSSEIIRKDLKLRDEDGPKIPVHIETKLLTSDLKEIERKALRRGFSIPNEVIVLNEDLIDFMNTSAFDHGETSDNDTVTFTIPAYLKLLGFRSIENFNHVYNTSPPLFVTADTSDGQTKQSDGGYSNSLKTFSLLYQSCLKLQKYAVVFGCIRRGTKPSLFALYPSKGGADAKLGEAAGSFPLGFLLIRLPWLDDIRSLPEKFIESKENQQTQEEVKEDALLKKVSDMYQKLLVQFNVHNYIPSDYPNPSLNYFHKVMKHELLQIDLNAEDVQLDKNDFTTLKLNALRARVNEVDESGESRSQLIKKLNNALDFYGAHVQPDLPSFEPPVKKQKVEIDELDFIKAWKNEALGKFTVPQLKLFQQKNKIKSGSKKQDLIDSINEYLRKSTMT